MHNTPFWGWEHPDYFISPLHKIKFILTQDIWGGNTVDQQVKYLLDSGHSMEDIELVANYLEINLEKELEDEDDN